MKYAIGILAVVFITILAVVLLSTSGSNTKLPGQKAVVLADHINSTATYDLTMDGPIVSAEKHQRIRIEVSENSRTIDVMTGYDNQVVRTQTYPNTHMAFSTFVHALDNEAFGVSKHASVKTEQGICPTGSRYIYDITDKSKQVQHLWGTSCNSSLASFGGNGPTVRSLFQQQIPDYSTLTTGYSFGF